MDSTTLKAQIDSQITNETAPNSISPADVGGNMKAVVDYTDQQAPTKTSGIVVLSDSVEAVLPKDINACNTANGLAYLPTTTFIGKEVIVLAVSNNITIYTNAAHDSRIFSTYPTMVSNIVLTTNKMYRFTYIGLGTGTGGTVNGYWKAELMN